MTDPDDVADRFEELEGLVEAQRERIDELEAIVDGSDRSVAFSRRTALKAGGIAGLLALGAGSASANPQGQVGTVDDPLRVLHTEELNGGITGGTAVTDLAGDALAIGGGSLTVATGPEFHVRNGELRVLPQDAWTNEPHGEAPPDLDDVLAGMYGSGTAEDPYLIRNDWELQAMNADTSAHYRLANDVDASRTGDWHGGSGFEPIDQGVDGTFDGAGNVVRGLTIDRGGERDVGLFGKTEGTVRNVGLDGVTVTGDAFVGGLAGEVWGSVKEVYVTGTVTGGDDVGGLFGFIGSSTLRTAYATADVTGDANVGGLVGESWGEVIESYATGNVDGGSAVGGLVGRNLTNVTHSYSAGAVDGSSDIGGLVGVGIGGSPGSYWDVPASGTDVSAEGVGLGALGETPPAPQMAGSTAADFMTNFDFGGIWSKVVAPEAYPVLKALDEATQLEARA